MKTTKKDNLCSKARKSIKYRTTRRQVSLNIDKLLYLPPNPSP
uniref:Uncharacterized protein n=1 Tax=Anguilla anguilla TaxID=7936 RepID=A0A0E9W484_ANGAN